jgi:hypothetical protein
MSEAMQFAVRSAQNDDIWVCETGEDDVRKIEAHDTEEAALESLFEFFLGGMEAYTSSLREALANGGAKFFYLNNESPMLTDDIIVRGRHVEGGFLTESGELYSIDGEDRLS